MLMFRKDDGILRCSNNMLGRKMVRDGTEVMHIDLTPDNHLLAPYMEEGVLLVL